MTTPKDEIAALRREFLENQDAEFLKHILVFSVASCIVKYHDPGLLRQFPIWVAQKVREMCDAYEEHGSYGIISNLGEVDHSEMVGKLVKVQKPEGGMPS